MSLVSTLSKKTSQLITILDPSCKKSRHLSNTSSELSQVDIAADVMTSSRSLINWLDRNSTCLVVDYGEFRQTILKDALELSSIPVRHLSSSLSHMHTHAHTYTIYIYVHVCKHKTYIVQEMKFSSYQE